MGMGTDHERGATVAEKSHRLFFARRFAVKVDDDGIGAAPKRTRRQLTVYCGERIVERIHENARHRIYDQHACAILGLDQRRAAARCARRIIDRANEPWRAFDENERLLLVPGMIAERDRIDAGIDQFAINSFGNAEAAGGILAVGHHQIELPVADEIRQPLVNERTAAASDNVANKKDAHAHAFRKSIVSFSVSTRSSGASKAAVGTRDSS